MGIPLTNKIMDNPIIYITFVVALIFAVIAQTHLNQRNELQSEAVKRGYAEWVCDLEGNSTFQWKGGAQ